MTSQTWEQHAQSFLTTLEAEATPAGLDLAAFEIDHLCWRTRTPDSYAAMKEFLNSVGYLLAETPVHGRPIASYKLKKPIRFGGQAVSVVECPAPKPGTDCPEGFEHAEVVISEDFECFMARHSHLSFDPSRAREPFNPELLLRLPTTNLKFHHATLERIIELESSRSVVWDLDGTILPAQQIRDLIHRTLERVLNREVSSSEFQSHFRTSYPELFGAFKMSEPEQATFFDVILTLQAQHPVQVYPEVTAIIDKLHEDPTVEQFLWTTRDRATTEWVLQQTKLKRYFKDVVDFGSRYSKPDPRSIRLVTDGQHPKRTFVVGDSTADKLAAEGYGAQFIGACWDPFHQVKDGIENPRLLYHDFASHF